MAAPSHAHRRKLGAVCPAGDFTPTGECLTVSNEATRFPCSASFAVDGLCIMANLSGVSTLYPANYGEGCGIHPEPGDSDCSYPDGTAKPVEEQADWCKMPWTYVNPCDCTVGDIHECRYFSPKKLYYSYSVCGSPNYGMSVFINVSSLSSDASKKLAATASCPSPAPPAALVQSPFNLPRSQPTSMKCQCMPMNKSVTVSVVNCSGQNISQNSMCINTTNLHGLIGLLPANYGSTCGLHAEPLDPGCFDLRTGRPWPAPCHGNMTAGCRQSRCDQPWCFVDPCCKGAVIDGGVLVPGTQVYLAYSYRNCGGNDTSRNASVLPNLTGIKCKPSAAFRSQALMTVAVIMLSLFL